MGEGMALNVYTLCQLRSFSLCAINIKTAALLLIHVGRVSRRERDDLVAGALLAVRGAVGPDEGVQVADWDVWLGAALQVEKVEVGLGAVHLGGGEGGGLERPRGCGGDELVQGLTVVVLQIQSERLS